MNISALNTPAGGGYREMLAQAVLIGTVFTFITFLWQSSSGSSKQSIFRAITLDDSPEQVGKLLRQHEISCEVDYEIAANPRYKSSCYFSDYWRRYAIAFDQDGKVIEKKIEFRRHFPFNIPRSFD